jgi:3-methyl-2-oxobutanoate hydroxymethyltransferase
VSTQARVSTSSLRAKKVKGLKITMLTAYDAPLASFIEKAGVDVVLVSDAVGTVGNGRSEAVSVTVEEMAYHTRAVRNGVKRSLVVTTLPFGSYNTPEEAVHSATRLMKEGGCDAVHLEGTCKDGDCVRAITGVGIPVMGHVGVTKQKIVSSGRIKLPAQDAGSAAETIKDALEMASSGCFAIVLECLPDRLARVITQSLDIPTISIGSGVDCDGQALVTQDMLGLYKEMSPRFLKVYADLSTTIVNALSQFRTEVESRDFPGPENVYSIDDAELEKLVGQLRR